MGFASKREGYQPTCEAKVELRMQCISHMYVRDKVEELSSCRFGVNEACKGEVGGVHRGRRVSKFNRRRCLCSC